MVVVVAVAVAAEAAPAPVVVVVGQFNYLSNYILSSAASGQPITESA
jgi:hypothetical protein